MVAHVCTRDISDPRAPGHREHVLELVMKHLEALLDATSTTSGKSVHEWSTDEDALCAKRERLEDV